MTVLLRWAMLALVATGLAACDETRFQSDLVDGGADCARDLGGYWRIEEDNEKGADFVAIGADCRVRFVTTRRDGGQERLVTIAFRPHLVAMGSKTYLTLTDDDFHRIGESSDAVPDEEARGHASANAGFHYFRLELKQAHLRLYGVDHNAVARRIIDGELDGEVHKIDKQVQNRVDGDVARMRKLVGERWLFQARTPLVLTRVEIDDVPASMRGALTDGDAR